MEGPSWIRRSFVPLLGRSEGNAWIRIGKFRFPYQKPCNIDNDIGKRNYGRTDSVEKQTDRGRCCFEIFRTLRVSERKSYRSDRENGRSGRLQYCGNDK